MRSLRFKSLRYLVSGLVTLFYLCVSTNSCAQTLTASLSLRLGPSAGFPYSIELPSGSDISIIRRQDDWLLVQDDRGETGWALLGRIDEAGGLEDRQAWRLKELKQPLLGQFSGQWFTDKSGQGWGIGWTSPFMDYRLTGEYQQSNNFDASWQSVSVWLNAEESLSSHTFYRYGVGLGYGLENESSFVLSDKGDANNSGYWGGQVSIGTALNQKFETGLRFRYLLAGLQGQYSSYQASWYWAIGI